MDLPAGVSQRVIDLAGRQALEAAVLALWREGELSTRQAASELSLTYHGFLDLLADKGLPVEDGLFDTQSIEAAGAQVRISASRTALRIAVIGLALSTASGCWFAGPQRGDDTRAEVSEITRSTAPPVDETPSRPAGEISVNPVDGAQMVWVPAGEFMMGSRGEWSSEQPVHPVRIAQGFWLYRTEVTNKQYRRYLAANPGGRRPHSLDGDEFSGPTQPIMGVSWDDAVAYSAWAGVRLPTEAEWEYAARGADGRTYPWGNQSPNASRAVFAHASFGPQPVGGREAGASWCGALDMAGNLWEWCADWSDYDYYAVSPRIDPRGPATGDARVLRGGSSTDDAASLRATMRWGSSPEGTGDSVGFRPVKAG